MKTYLKYFLKCWAISLMVLASTTHAQINFNGFASIRATSLDSDGGSRRLAV